CEMEFESALRLRGINVEDVGRIRRACTKLESVLAPRAKTIAEAVYVVNGEIRKTIRDQEIEIGLTAQSAIRNRMRSEGDTLEKRVRYIPAFKPCRQRARFVEERPHSEAVAAEALRQRRFHGAREDCIRANLMC